MRRRKEEKEEKEEEEEVTKVTMPYCLYCLRIGPIFYTYLIALIMLRWVEEECYDTNQMLNSYTWAYYENTPLRFNVPLNLWYCGISAFLGVCFMMPHIGICGICYKCGWQSF